MGDKDQAFDIASKQSYPSAAHATFGERSQHVGAIYSVAAANPGRNELRQV
jgi:hypothetical protein